MNAFGSRRQPLFAELPAANSRHVRSVAFGDPGTVSGRVPRVSTEMPMPHPVSSGWRPTSRFGPNRARSYD